MDGICMNFLDPVQFFRFLKGRCHGNQFCVVPDFFARSQSISGSAGPIFAIFAPNDRYLFVDDRSWPPFLIPQGTLPWQPIKVEKLAFYGPIYLLRCHSETDCNIAISISKD